MSEISSETRFLHAIDMGLGAWQWGDRVVWQYGHGYGESQVQEAFLAAINEGIRFVDTAELYGNGLSERLLGRFIKETDQPVLIATKFFPWPWRFYKGAIPRALKASLARLNVDGVDLYQIHWPNPILSTDMLMEGLAECVKSGLTRTVGVSNFGQSRMLAAYSSLARHNVPLASNQVHYSLLNRTFEKDGTLARCKELGIRPIAYSPIEKGLLAGKYSVENPPPGARCQKLRRTSAEDPTAVKADDRDRTGPRRQIQCAGSFELGDLQGRDRNPGREERSPGSGKCRSTRLEINRGRSGKTGRGKRQGS